jgi:hypothetical protein
MFFLYWSPPGTSSTRICTLGSETFDSLIIWKLNVSVSIFFILVDHFTHARWRQIPINFLSVVQALPI